MVGPKVCRGGTYRVQPWNKVSVQDIKKCGELGATEGVEDGVEPKTPSHLLCNVAHQASIAEQNVS